MPKTHTNTCAHAEAVYGACVDCGQFGPNTYYVMQMDNKQWNTTPEHTRKQDAEIYHQIMVRVIME